MTGTAIAAQLLLQATSTNEDVLEPTLYLYLKDDQRDIDSAELRWLGNLAD